MFSRLIRGWGKDKMTYPVMREILTASFSCYHDDFDNAVGETAACYFDTNVLSKADARNEIGSLLRISDDEELKTTSEQLDCDHFRPEPWGETWRSFLEKIAKAIRW
ncbi:hypothetical protein C1N58_10055 [Pantoea sp. SGAir0180]|uniref:contact-dependent growth inhibition system immunity protein n=1 Tax=Pantoea stewartii TaxID=66269 RepID=UPI00054304FE|nr:contact-dependent growth inhibition system immunity protein [Pantoea stewartii]KHE03229.1 hypothetical protein NL54_01180 [Pantoea stewartii]KHN62072.1 hypothetical protein OI73_14640 [Pantoea stewartii]